MNDDRPATGRLAAGPIRRWVRGKPRLAATLTPGAGSSQTVESSWSDRLGVIFRATIVLVGFTVAIVAATWAMLCLTVLATPTINGNIWAVQRGAWVQGEAPNGSTAVSVSAPIANTPGERFADLLNGYPNPSIVRILAGPGQQIATNVNGELVVDGTPTGIALTTPVTRATLGDEYLTACLTGACGATGTPNIIPVTHILGKPLSGLGAPALPRLPGEQAHQ